ncbi:lactoylglutathione lyase [Pseudoalteromonas distincta]|uniref:lactoylglutathione lyase n=1 Tax=Pseudoalteromonas distincta TaxID=77608 RepID=UPI0011F20469|nr:lactoylglutathione lyase [Pseudoalteromonas distincta]KAA1161956.1 lactoylglutathione lyase [Pseudoalteromonas distincta]
MQVDDIRVFIPCKNYEQSQCFYKALGFKVEDASNDLCVCTFGECTFFLQRYYNKTFAENLMLQLCVLNIDEAYELISNLNGFDIRFEGIKQEPWGSVIYLWGPSGELWHVTELN